MSAVLTDGTWQLEGSQVAGKPAEDDTLDARTVLVVICAVFVLLMTIPGLSLYYGSLVSKNNLLDTMLQSVVLAATIPLCWWMVSYSLCFDTTDFPLYGGVKRSFLMHMSFGSVGSLPESAWCLFQLTFAIITPAIAVGAVVERTLFWPLVLLANLWHFVVYCPICYMVWGGGLLWRWGVLDTAGGLVVQTSSGVSALVLCYFIGQRNSHLSEAASEAGADDRDPSDPQPRLQIIGAALLWVGWLALTAGCSFTSGSRVGIAALNTLLAGSSASMSWMAVSVCMHPASRVSSPAAAYNLMGGAIAGLCAATPSAGYVSGTGAVVIGVGAGIICQLTESQLMVKILQPRGFDDAVSVFPVHGIGGIWGTIMTGVYALEEVGGKHGALQGDFGVLHTQFLAVCIVSAWSLIGTALCAWSLRRVGLLRIPAAEEDLPEVQEQPNLPELEFSRTVSVPVVVCSLSPLSPLSPRSRGSSSVCTSVSSHAGTARQLCVSEPPTPSSRLSTLDDWPKR